VKKAAERDKSSRSKSCMANPKKLAAFYVAQGQEKPEKLWKVMKN